MIKFKDPWDGSDCEARLSTDKYVRGNRLFIELEVVDEEVGCFLPYCPVTVNIPDEKISNENCGFLDTNNASWLPRFVVQNGLGVPTGRVGYSGHCVYPEFDFTEMMGKVEGKYVR